MAESPALNTPVATDTVSIIQGILDREAQGIVKAAATEAAPEQESPTQEVSQPEAEEAPAEDNRQVEGGGAPAEQAVAEIPLDQLEAIQLEVEVSGESGKVTEKPTIKELKLGYMRQKDYQQKTAEVARQRNEVGDKIRQGIESERKAYAQTLQQLQTAFVQTVAPELAKVNWNELATNDPAEYVRLRNRAEQIQTVIKDMQSKQQALTAKQQAEQSQVLQQTAIKTRETLEREIPGWNDALYQKLMKTGTEYGYKPEEVGSWVDPRAVKLLHDAYQYRELKVKTPDDKRVVTPPKVIRPGATTAQSQTRKNTDIAMRKLQTSGRVEDAAAVIRARMR
jgi:uncharacterized protein YeeX (DUF496 family)